MLLVHSWNVNHWTGCPDPLVFLILFIQPAWYLYFSTWFIKNMSVM